MEVNPLSIILVKSDSKGDRLLFRYPYNVPQQFQASVIPARKTPYSIVNSADDILQNAPPTVSNICFGKNREICFFFDNAYYAYFRSALRDFG